MLETQNERSDNESTNARARHPAAAGGGALLSVDLRQPVRERAAKRGRDADRKELRVCVCTFTSPARSWPFANPSSARSGSSPGPARQVVRWKTPLRAKNVIRDGCPRQDPMDAAPALPPIRIFAAKRVWHSPFLPSLQIVWLCNLPWPGI